MIHIFKHQERGAPHQIFFVWLGKDELSKPDDVGVIHVLKQHDFYTRSINYIWEQWQGNLLLAT